MNPSNLLAQATGPAIYDAMPTLLGLRTIRGPLEITVSHWMTGFFLLALCAVPLYVVMKYLLSERRYEMPSETHGEPSIETLTEEELAERERRKTA